MKEQIAGGFFLTSQLESGYADELEQLFYFNENQWKLSEVISRSVEAYGTPRISASGEWLRLEFKDITHAQTLYLVHDETNRELAGVVIYVREDERLRLLYVALKPKYTFPEFEDRCLLASLVEALRNIGGRIKGITYVEFGEGPGSLKFRVACGEEEPGSRM
jgi:hypothetical protein